MTLQQLILIKPDDRDEKWETEFLDKFVHANVELISEDPQPGPDGFPYLFVKTSENATEPTLKVLDWLALRGIGLAVNPQNETPDYVFTYGMIWNFKERNRFITPIESTRSNRLEIETGQTLYYGDFAEDFFPSYARKILREFLLQQGVLNPKFLIISKDQRDYDICFSLNSIGFPEASEHQGIAEAISWFFPFNSSIALIEEKNLPAFYDL